MPAPWTEWAFDTSQNVPAQLVSRDDRAIDDLVEGTFGSGTYRNSEVLGLNPIDVYPVVRVSDPHSSTDVPNPPVETYEPEGGGLVYRISQSYTPAVVVPPTLDETKAAALITAEQQGIDFLNGGFFFDDGGGNELYDTDPPLRSLYAEIGVEAAYVGAAFSVTVRDAGSITHAFNNNEWIAAYHEFYLHIVLAKEEVDAARLEIVLAPDEAAVQVALDAMSPPNNTL